MTRKEKVFSNVIVDTKVVLAGLWLVVMLLYIYCDFFSFYRTGQIENISKGKMGFFDVNQMTLLTASLLMIIPTLMIILSLLLPARINRIVNIVVGILYLFVNIGNIISETWIYYFAFGILEIIFVGVVVIKSIKWPQISD